MGRSAHTINALLGLVSVRSPVFGGPNTTRAARSKAKGPRSGQGRTHRRCNVCVVSLTPRETRGSANPPPSYASCTTTLVLLVRLSRCCLYACPRCPAVYLVRLPLYFLYILTIAARRCWGSWCKVLGLRVVVFLVRPPCLPRVLSVLPVCLFLVRPPAEPVSCTPSPTCNVSCTATPEKVGRWMGKRADRARQAGSRRKQQSNERPGFLGR